MKLDPATCRVLSELLDTALDMSEAEQTAWLDRLSIESEAIIQNGRGFPRGRVAYTLLLAMIRLWTPEVARVDGYYDNRNGT
jgi:hypothetical protein